MKKRVVAILLALAMLLSLAPVYLFALDEEDLIVYDANSDLGSLGATLISMLAKESNKKYKAEINIVYDEIAATIEVNSKYSDEIENLGSVLLKGVPTVLNRTAFTETENRIMLAFLQGVFTDLVVEINKYPDDITYIVSLGRKLMNELISCKTIGEAEALFGACFVVRANMEANPSQKKNVCSLGLYLLDAVSKVPSRAADFLVDFEEIVTAISLNPDGATGLISAGKQLMSSLASLANDKTIDEKYYQLRKLELKAAYTKVALSIGVNTAAAIETAFKKLTDVPEDEWYYEYVKYCVEKKLILGSSETKFSPNAKITRGMLVNAIWKLEGSPRVIYNLKFNDLDNNKYAEAIRWTLSRGIINGYNDETFGPNDSVTREQFAKILYEYAKYKGNVTEEAIPELPFRDLEEIDDWAMEAVMYCYDKGYISGYEGKDKGKFKPLGTTTKAEASKMLRIFIEGPIEEETEE